MVAAGAIALLLEAVPSEVAAAITQATELPVTGIVSGPSCDGQVVVLHDMVGYGGGHPPRSVKQYVQLYEQLVGAFKAYAKDVNEGAFPTAEQSIAMDRAQLDEFRQALQKRKM